MILSLVSKRYPNNTNLNITKATTTKREKDAVVAVDFKKLKEEGEERIRAIKKQMVELDFKEELIEKILKEYSTQKIEEKLDLLMERKNIQRPAGWLRAALKNDYRREEPVRENEGDKCRGLIHQTRLESAGRMNPSPTKAKTSSEDNKILSAKEVRELFKLLRHELMAMDSP